MNKLLYVVALRGVPIGVHQAPWMALAEAKERSLDLEPATVAAYRYVYPLVPEAEDFEEVPTDPDCVLCSHGESCDDLWKPGPV